MANTVRNKRGSGSDPSASDLVLGEIAVRTDTGQLFVKKDDGSVASIAGGITDGDKGDISVSNSGTTFTIDNGVISTAKIADEAVTLAKLEDFSSGRILGRLASGTGETSQLTASSVRSIINVEDGATADQSASEIVALIADQTIAPSTIDMEDNEKIKLGTGDDLELFHNGTDSHIDNNTGDLYLTTTGSGDDIHIKAVDDVHIKVQGSENAISCQGNGSVDLYFDGIKTLETISGGAKLLGGEGIAAHLYIFADEGDDNADKWVFRADASSSQLKLRNFASGSWEESIIANGNGSVEIYHDNSKKFETTSDGITVTEGITIDAPDDVTSTGGDFALNLQGGDAINDIVNLRFATGADGSLANISALAEATGSYPNSSGSLILSVQSGGGTFEGLRINSSRNVGIGITSPSTKLHVNGTVTATAYAGDGSNLTGIAAGATGGGSDEIFYENGQNVTTDYTITNGKNAMSAGPITINSGVTVTVGSGETLTIV